MSRITRDDRLILELFLCQEDFSICHELFEKNYSFLEFLEAENLDLAYGRTQSRLRHLITVVKPWSCVKEKITSFMSTTGIELSDPRPCTVVWNGFCTIGCPLCNALKNYALKNDMHLGRRWKYRSTYRRLHGRMLTIIINFLQNNIVRMVKKHFQNKPYVAVPTSYRPPGLVIEEDSVTVNESPATLDEISSKSEVEPSESLYDFIVSKDRTPTEEEILEFFGIGRDCSSLGKDHVVEDDNPRPSDPSDIELHRTIQPWELEFDNRLGRLEK
jgi:hypothetical protein